MKYLLLTMALAVSGCYGVNPEALGKYEARCDEDRGEASFFVCE